MNARMDSAAARPHHCQKRDKCDPGKDKAKLGFPPGMTNKIADWKRAS